MGELATLVAFALIVGIPCALAGKQLGVETVCREAGYYNTLESCKGVTYPKGDEDAEAN